MGAAMAVPDGFEIHEFAGPPDVDYPTAVYAAANGDVYVSSDPNGSLGHNKNFGKVVRCRDTDGDGKADQFQDFIPKVTSPRGGHMVGGTLYLIHPPFLTAYRDSNGDGVADEAKDLVTGLGGGIENPRGADHTTNGVRMGIDGWLYISVGDFGATPAKGTDGSTVELHGGGVLRVRPDGSRLEAYSVMVRNICDTAISPVLDLFSRDNTNDGKGWNTRFHHFTALSDHGYPRLYQNFADEAVKPLADYGGGSGTGALWLSEPGFPPEFTDALFSADWTTGTIHYHPWKRAGASYSVEQKTFMKLPRAIDIDVDGSSRLYLADWRNGGFDFAGPGKPVGKIHQVTYQKLPRGRYAEVSMASDGDLIGLLASPSAVQRLEVQREILKRGKKSAFASSIFAIAGNAGLPVAVRAAAIFTFKQLYGSESTRYLAELVSDATVREFVLRAMTDSLGELPGVPEKPYLDGLNDANSRVVMQALIGLQRLKAKSSAAAILAASRSWKEADDSPRLEHTAMQVLVRLENVSDCLAALGDRSTRKLALLALMRIHRMEVVHGLIAGFSAVPDPESKFDILSALARLAYREKHWDRRSWWNTRPDDRGPYFEPVEWEGTNPVIRAIEVSFSGIPQPRQNEMMAVLAKNRIAVSDLKLAGADPVMAALEAAKPNDSQVLLLADAAKDGGRSHAQRISAYRALMKAPGDQVTRLAVEILALWSVDPKKPAEVDQLVGDFVNSPQRSNELNLLREIAARQNGEASAIAWKSMLTVMNSPLAKPEAKDIIRSYVAGNPMEPGFFLALNQLKLSGFDGQITAALKSDNRELIAAANAAKSVAAGAGQSGRKVAELPAGEVVATAMNGKGDPELGSRLFTSQGCIACHSVDPKAEQKGPYLGAAGAKFTRDYLIESILDPNKVVAQGFQTTLLKLKDGGVKMGFVTGEADGIVEVRDIAGQVSKIQRSDVVEETHLPNSMMPPGLAAELSIGDFTSLVEYLVSLRATGG
jgi:putative heme-binding domain-containing protein